MGRKSSVEEEVSSDDETYVEKPNAFKELLKFVNFRWLKTPTGFLKIVQFGTMLMGLILVGSVTTGDRASMEFFVFTVTSAWVFIIMILITLILDVYQSIPRVLINNRVLFIGSSIGGLVLMGSSAIMMAKNKNHKSVTTAGIFGLISMGLTMIEAVYYLIQWKRYGANPELSEPLLDNDNDSD
ncbi:uncharacterized protein [Clytia hemisphaerica]|uniref:MARVEL domain-containing protein n=1 Tax=Clytia hemisphaerica TaxID=252671 RepID=A0A7M5WSV0_9CNID|eukprot:TCONS_00024619-protein